jgi:cell division protein FtsB
MMMLLTPTKLWLSIFSLWTVILSGATATWTGPPGFIQAIRLRSLLSTKQLKVSGLQDEVQKLMLESHQLEKSKVAQQREIRKVLGYAAADEIIFDFTQNERL